MPPFPAATDNAVAVVVQLVDTRPGAETELDGFNPGGNSVGAIA